jgi:kynurenine formamidase
MEYLGSKQVMTLGLDSASMGPLPDLAVATHQAGGKLGMIWIECGTNLGKLPETGAFYAMLPAKHAGGSGGECRPIAITEPTLAKELIDRARKKQVVDLSVTLHEDYPITWPGFEAGDEASRYVSKTLNAFSKARGPYFALTHMLDSQAGTHIVLPSAYLPPMNFDRSQFSIAQREMLAAYEKEFGRLGSQQTTIDQAPLNEMMGRARVIDVQQLVGTTKPSDWPASPIITLNLVKQFEQSQGPIQRGDVVLFLTGHSDKHYQPLPESPALDPMMASPLAGKSEGWPTPSTEVIEYLANKDVRCIGTDAPRLGGVNRTQSTKLNWLTASRSLMVVEFLSNLSEIQDRDAFFIFAPIKIRGLVAGYGRAIALVK